MKFTDEIGFGVPAVLSAIGGTISLMLGGWDILIQLLITFIVIDYVTGVLSGIKTKSLSSDVMYWGGIRKGITLVVIAVAVMLDELINGGSPVFRTLALYFYIGREGLSVIENLAVLGVPLPAFIKSTLRQIQRKGGK